MAWTFRAGSFITTTINFPTSASGQIIILRWRLGTDTSNGASGWYIDNIVVSETIVPDYSWSSAPVGFSSGMQNPTGVFQDVSRDCTIVVSAMGCSSSTSTGIINAILSPVITLGENPVVCSRETITDLRCFATSESPDEYSIDFNLAAEAAGFVDVSNVTWPASPIVLVVPGAAPPVANTAMLTVTNRSTGCVSNRYSVSIIVLVEPDPGTVSGVTPLCRGNTETYVTSGDTGGEWSSTDPLVASVDQNTGLATALTAGTTEIIYIIRTSPLPVWVCWISLFLLTALKNISCSI